MRHYFVVISSKSFQCTKEGVKLCVIVLNIVQSLKCNFITGFDNEERDFLSHFYYFNTSIVQLTVLIINSSSNTSIKLLSNQMIQHVKTPKIFNSLQSFRCITKYFNKLEPLNDTLGLIV